MPVADQLEVLVIGAGIGGLTTAIALLQAGMRVRVFERRGDLNEVLIGGGMILWANAMRALQQLGLAEDVARIAFRVRAAQQRSARGELLGRIPVRAFDRAHGAPSVSVSRPNLHAVLHAALGGVEVNLNAECTAFVEDESGVVASFADGSQVRGDALICADGRNSRLRAQVNAFSGRFPPYAGYTHWSAVARIAHPKAPQGLFRVSTGRGWEFFYFHIDPGEIYWAAAGFIPEGGRDPEGTHKQTLLKQFRGWEPPIEALIEASGESEIVRRDIHGGRPVPVWGRGRMTLLGDAAHPMSTTLGQGACSAIEDAVILRRCLTAGGPVDAALRRYEQLRKERTAALMRVARFLESGSAATNPVQCWVRDQAIKAVFRYPPLLKRFPTFRVMTARAL